MDRLNPDRAAAILEAARRVRVLVVGDLMLDRYISGAVDRISPEAPVPVVRVEEESWAVGGAGNVAANVAATGAALVSAALATLDCQKVHTARSMPPYTPVVGVTGTAASRRSERTAST